jgi:hypothetical protein
MQGRGDIVQKGVELAQMDQLISAKWTPHIDQNTAPTYCKITSFRLLFIHPVSEQLKISAEKIFRTLNHAETFSKEDANSPA